MNLNGQRQQPAPLPVDFSSVPVDSLETLRNRLNQVHISLRKLFDQINHHNRHPSKVRLPSYTHLQSQFQILLTQLHLLTANLEANGEILKTTNVYPLPSFPATQQENLLTTLLRKKPLPEIDEWIENALVRGKHDDEGLATIQLNDEFAQWCLAKVEELQEEFQFWGFNTTQELEHAASEQGKQEKAEKEAIEREKKDLELKITDNDRKPLHPNQVLKFMYQDVNPVTPDI